MIELHVLHSHIAGVLFDFMGWLTSREKRLTLSSIDEAGPAVEAITEFAKMRSLRLEDAQVEHWQSILTTPQPQQEPVGKFAKFTDGIWREVTDGSAGVPLYTTPQPQADELTIAYMDGLSQGKKQAEKQDVPEVGFGNMEPVACKTLCELCVKRGYNFCANAAKTTPIITTPAAQRQWVGLTDGEIIAVNMSTVTKLIDDPIVCDTDHNIIQLGKAIEVKLKEKNT